MKSEDYTGAALDVFKLIESGENEKAKLKGHESLMSKDQTEISSIHELLGLVAYMEADYLDALSHFKLGRESVEKYFNLACTSALLKKFEDAEEYFESCGQRYASEISSGEYEGYSGSEMQFTYASKLVESGEYSLSFRFLMNLANIYSQLVITEDSFLGIRKVPPFEMYLELLKSVQTHADPVEFAEMIQLLKENVDEEGQASIKKWCF